ncbi:DUF981 family protein [Leucobacter chromiiresistens]|uniref:DUF981 domain-containing protein n=1 Tax=Leucobacter chromiiresistens TaxID=1079994 RepID=A0A1H0YYW6_9MICO|nr:DUF981 family protein [Leucobacter chromiiresistens]SDQ20467.1 Protein of unknown function [Leucobacter chromiiresistens]
MHLMETDGLVVDWTLMPTYNTIMSLAAGAGLLWMLGLVRALRRPEGFAPEGWALTAAVLGGILTLTGAHMTLTWPLAAYFPFDNIIFGEPSLGFGVLLLAAAFLLWRRSAVIAASPDPGAQLARTAYPFGVFVFGLGLAMFGIAAAGMVFQLFAAPPEEPISGAFAEYPWVEATFMSGLFALVGVGAVLFPFALRGFSSAAPKLRPVAVVAGAAWGLAGLAFLLFGALNYFTHIGLIINTTA